MPCQPSRTGAVRPLIPLGEAGRLPRKLDFTRSRSTAVGLEMAGLEFALLTRQGLDRGIVGHDTLIAVASTCQGAPNE